jgi:Ca2+-binding EF-hand superfamily protein
MTAPINYNFSLQYSRNAYGQPQFGQQVPMQQPQVFPPQQPYVVPQQQFVAPQANPYGLNFNMSYSGFPGVVNNNASGAGLLNLLGLGNVNQDALVEKDAMSILKQNFKDFDRDKDGQLSEKELKRAQRKMGDRYEDVMDTVIEEQATLATAKEDSGKTAITRRDLRKINSELNDGEELDDIIDDLKAAKSATPPAATPPAATPPAATPPAAAVNPPAPENKQAVTYTADENALVSYYNSYYPDAPIDAAKARTMLAGKDLATVKKNIGMGYAASQAGKAANAASNAASASASAAAAKAAQEKSSGYGQAQASAGAAANAASNAASSSASAAAATKQKQKEAESLVLQTWIDISGNNGNYLNGRSSGSLTTSSIETALRNKGVADPKAEPYATIIRNISQNQSILSFASSDKNHAGNKENINDALSTNGGMQIADAKAVLARINNGESLSDITEGYAKTLSKGLNVSDANSDGKLTVEVTNAISKGKSLTGAFETPTNSIAKAYKDAKGKDITFDTLVRILDIQAEYPKMTIAEILGGLI